MFKQALLAAIALPLFAAIASPATIVVNDESGAYHDPGCGTSGVGQCTLVDAIAFANANSGPDAIHFNIPGGGTRTIQPTAPLPALTDGAGVTIDGYTQPGASANTLTVGSNAVWRIVLSGASVNTTGSGVRIESDHNVVRGLFVRNWTDGIQIAGGSNNLVAGNLVGRAEPGDFTNGNGISLRTGAQTNFIGGTTPTDRNVVSGNAAGIYLTDFGTTNNIIRGNLVGLSPDGTTAVLNYRGISFFQGSGSGPSVNVIGGTLAGAGNVISGSETSGVDILGACSQNQIVGNRIGTSADGSAGVPNLSSGVSISGGAFDNIVGGTLTGAGNLISGNGVGVSIEGLGTDGNQVAGNRIGTNLSGTAALPNGYGVGIGLFAQGNVVGGATSLARNVISGNTYGAVGITLANNNSVIGNFIGTDLFGTGRLGNAQDIVTPYYAVQIAGASQNHVESNVIAFNGNQWVGGGGILVLESNQPGDTVGNSLLGNSIHDNYGLGIDLYEAGIPYRPTPNDEGDGDSGPNGFQNFPVIQSVTPFAGGITVGGSLNSTPNSAFTIQFFSSPRCDESGHGEGTTFVGSALVGTDPWGNATFNIPLDEAPTGGRITATATDSAGSTSEFSRCFPGPIGFHTVTPCRVADTRDPEGPWGGPALAGTTVRNFPIVGRCGIPETAQAVAFNFAATGANQIGNLTVFPVGTRFPLASTLNMIPGKTRANNAIIPVGTDGEIAIYCGQSPGGTTHVVIDVNGYFE